MREITYRKVFNKDWFDQIEIWAQLIQEITYHKLFCKKLSQWNKN